MKDNSGNIPDEWFKDWFNTRYYHILYQHRNDWEAGRFIDNLISWFQPAATARFLDLACGKGRHSIYLANKGFKVTGLDLSPENIAAANRSARPGLTFAVHDMRAVFPGRKFDYIFNLFTSFGYFDSPAENQEVVNSMAEMLVNGGRVVVDFLNPARVPATESVWEKELDGILFKIRKTRENNRVVKQIEVVDGDKTFHFQEEVHLFSEGDFLSFFQNAGLQWKMTFGDYQLNIFDPTQSERMILIAQKG